MFQFLFGKPEILFREEMDNGLIVSTIKTPDLGIETAIIDSEGAHPVQRYATKFEAELGHIQWVDFARDGIGKEIVKLGGALKFATDQFPELADKEPFCIPNEKVVLK